MLRHRCALVGHLPPQHAPRAGPRLATTDQALGKSISPVEPLAGRAGVEIAHRAVIAHHVVGVISSVEARFTHCVPRGLVISWQILHPLSPLTQVGPRAGVGFALPRTRQAMSGTGW